MRVSGPVTRPPPRTGRVGEAPAVPLNIPLPMLTYIIAKAREFDADLSESSPPSADSFLIPDLEDDFLPSSTDDTPYDDLHSALALLNDEQMVTLVALLWVGRGDFDRHEWRQARLAASEILDERDGVEYLCGTPLIADYLAEGLDTLGHRLDEPGALVL